MVDVAPSSIDGLDSAGDGASAARRTTSRCRRTSPRACAGGLRRPRRAWQPSAAEGGGSCGFAPTGVGWTKPPSADSPLIGSPLCGAQRPHSYSERRSFSNAAGRSRASSEQKRSTSPSCLNLKTTADEALDLKGRSGLTSTTVALARTGPSGGERSDRPSQSGAGLEAWSGLQFWGVSWRMDQGVLKAPVDRGPVDWVARGLGARCSE